MMLFKKNACQSEKNNKKLPTELTASMYSNDTF